MKIPHFRFGSSTVCTYCGDVPTGYDHVLAVAAQTISRKGHCRTGYGPTTHSCSSCNSEILGSKGFDSFFLRCQHVSNRIARKAKPVEWSNAQLRELDHNLRSFIETENNRRLWWRYRADWFQGRDWVLNLESLLHEPCFDPMSPKFCDELFRYFDSTIRFVRILKPEW